MTESRGRRWALTGARSVTGAVVAGAAVLAVAVGIAAPWPQVTREPVAVVAAPTPADSVVACDGAVLAAGRNSRSAVEVTVAAQPVPLVAADDAQPVEDIEMASPDVQGLDGAPAFAAPPRDRIATGLAAATSARIADEDLAGFTTDACRPPLFESWLVGGDTSTGTTDLVLLSNPGDVAATVDLTVYGAAEPAVPPGGSGVTIPARTQRVISLAGLAIGEESPVLRITATGAPVRASLQSSLVRTLVPGGLDQQSAIAAPDRLQAIPGVAVTSAPGAAGASNPATIVRVLAPTESGEATVTVTAVGSTAPVMAPSTIPVAAGSPTELELGSLAVGTYVVTVDATVPVVAATWQTTGFGAGSDFAWYTSAPSLDSPALIAVPSGPSPFLQLSNPGDDTATVTLRAVSGGGAERTIEVPAGGSAAIAVNARTVWSIDPGEVGDVHAQVTFTGVGALAGMAVWPSDAAAAPVLVYP